MIVVLCLIMAVSEPRFFGVPNMMIILHDAAIFMVLGMAMTLVITARGIDLSIGAVAALSALVMALLIKDYGVNVYLAMAVALAIGLLCGLINSLIITQLKVPDLLATLAMDQVYRGFSLVVAAGVVLARFPEPIPFIGRGRILGGIPVSTIIGILALAAGVIIYRYTHIGRYSAAIGGNREAAILSGGERRPPQDHPVRADGWRGGGRGHPADRAAECDSGHRGAGSWPCTPSRRSWSAARYSSAVAARCSAPWSVCSCWRW